MYLCAAESALSETHATVVRDALSVTARLHTDPSFYVHSFCFSTNCIDSLVFPAMQNVALDLCARQGFMINVTINTYTLGGLFYANGQD